MIRRLAARGVDGLIAVSMGTLDRDGLSDRDLLAIPPIVSVDHPGAAGHALLFDAEQGGYLAARHLIEHGHERIGLVTAPLGWANVRPLRDGYVRALMEAGLGSDERWISEVPDFSFASGRRGIARLLELPDPPRAVFAVGAGLALAAVDEARNLGVRVPEDLALVGYTDIEAAALVRPPLTMVSVPSREIGIRAMRTLRRLIDGEDVPEDPVVLDVELIVRASCGAH
jgi:DNA-binding LacI/PurR family transcriptional regulator